jgi:hypothetical protein
MRKTLYTNLARAFFAALALSAAAPVALAQDGNKQPAKPAPSEATKAQAAKPSVKAATTDVKAVSVVERAVEVLGGRAYMDVRTKVSRGHFTPFREGVQTPPSSFLDYTVFPDRERTDFKGQGVKIVQVNTGETGWIYDGQAKKISDLKSEQVADFRTVMRTSLDNVLRGWWRAEGASLAYAGRREAGLARRNETVRLIYPDGFEVEFEFDAKEGLPAKVKYKKQNAEGEQVEEEDRYAQFLNIGAVSVPFIIDHYRAGVQSSRVNYDEIQFNLPVSDSLFAKPVNVKSLK